MTEYIASDGERLDSIVYNYYGTLQALPQVLSANAALTVVLRAGDKVLLPDIETAESKEYLW